MKYFAAQLLYRVTDAASLNGPYLVEVRVLAAGEESAALLEARRLGTSSEEAGHRNFLCVRSLEEIPLHTPGIRAGQTQEYHLADPLA